MKMICRLCKMEVNSGEGALLYHRRVHKDCKKKYLLRMEKNGPPNLCKCGNPKQSESPLCAECTQDKKEAFLSLIYP